MTTTIEKNIKTGSNRTIVADPAPSGYEFYRWIGDISALTSSTSSYTTVTMPSTDVTVEATYRNLIKYGLLYNWYAAVRPQTVEYGYLYNRYSIDNTSSITSSNEWVVPSAAQFNTLRDYLGGAATARQALKEVGTTYWIDNNGTNTVGFNARGSGLRISIGFQSIRSITYFRCSDPHNGSVEILYRIDNANSGSAGSAAAWITSKTDGHPIRLLYTGVGTPTSYIGNDGKQYSVVTIGTQTWLSENLMETKYRNGDEITEIADQTTWNSTTTGARCAYNNTITNVGLGNAITSSDDWVVPTTTQLDALISYLGGVSVAGGKMKEVGLSYWNTPNTGATNESAWNGRGSGVRYGGDGSFVSIKNNGQYLHSDRTFYPSFPYAEYFAIYELSHNGANVNVGVEPNVERGFRWGQSLRLLYTGVGTPTSYTGNDGKVYRVVTVGTQTWLADNLAETKYRDGSYISGYNGGVYTPISNATWAALTTGALCAYNNDTNNI